MCICSPINIYKQISNTSMYVFFSYNITGDLLHRVPLTQVLFFAREVQGTGLYISKGSLFSNLLENNSYIRKMTKSSVTNNSIC